MENEFHNTWIMILGAFILLGIVLYLGRQAVTGTGHSVTVSPCMGIKNQPCGPQPINNQTSQNYNNTVNPGGPCIGINGQPCGFQSNGTSKIAVNLTQELNNSRMQGFNLSISMFSSNSSASCYKQLITQCNNNEPGQFICINEQYSNLTSSQYSRVYNSSMHACPMFLLAGTVSCGISDNNCVVIESGPS